jgi:hypothetical protein
MAATRALKKKTSALANFSLLTNWSNLMTLPLMSSQDDDSFVLSINGKQQTYTNDKAGKRQAILDGLNAIETITSGKVFTIV